MKQLTAGIIALLIFTNVFLVYIYQLGQGEKMSAQNIALALANELGSLSKKLDKQNTMITRINSTVRTLTEGNHNYTGLLSSYGTQIDNLKDENMKLAKEISDLRDLTPVHGVPAQNRTILVRRMQFQEVDQAYSPRFIRTSPLFDNSSRGLTLNLLPESFVVNRTWSRVVHNYVNNTVYFVTWLRSGEIVSYRFNATNRISFYLGLWSGDKVVSVDGVSSYGETYRVLRTGVYVFDFAVPDGVHSSEYSSVSFRCYEVTIS